MNQHDHNKHHHQQHAKKGRAVHKDWRAWVVVLLALAAMLMYVLSDDEALQPGGNREPGMPADSAPMEAAP